MKAIPELSADLIRCPSITPEEGGALLLIQQLLKERGFSTEIVVFEEVTNLYARLGKAGPHLCFAGHTDVVPVGDRAGWMVDPFGGVIQDGKLWGRGAADMKGAIACFITAVDHFLKSASLVEGSISLLLTSDEEGPAVHGIQKMISWLKERGEVPDLCLIGEPTGPHEVGKMLKIGRRGSITGRLTCMGKQGHIAYPHLADNPIPRLLRCLEALTTFSLDEGTQYFEPSRLEITSVDVGNPVTNIIPHQASARFGIRLNTTHKSADLCTWVRTVCDTLGGKHTLELTSHGEAFLTTDAEKIALISQAVEEVMGQAPELSTTGGTTDGRFLIHLCPVVECGLPEDTIHQVNEHVSLNDLMLLERIYGQILKRFLGRT